MDKISSISIGFTNFKLVPKKRLIRHDSNKKLTKLIKGICLKDGDDYKIQVDVKALKPDIIDKSHPDIILLDFTEESYNLKGVSSVFSKTLDERGNYIRYIRTESNSKCFPGNIETYVPFCHNWVCSGYIVRRNSKLMFDFNDCIAPKGYDVFMPEEDEQ